MFRLWQALTTPDPYRPVVGRPTVVGTYLPERNGMQTFSAECPPPFKPDRRRLALRRHK